jgi:hypothetical protein
MYNRCITARCGSHDDRAVDRGAWTRRKTGRLEGVNRESSMIQLRRTTQPLPVARLRRSERCPKAESNESLIGSGHSHGLDSIGSRSQVGEIEERSALCRMCNISAQACTARSSNLAAKCANWEVGDRLPFLLHFQLGRKYLIEIQ